MAAYSFPIFGRGRSRMGGSGGGSGGGGGADGAGRALGAALTAPPAPCNTSAFLHRTALLATRWPRAYACRGQAEVACWLHEHMKFDLARLEPVLPVETW